MFFATLEPNKFLLERRPSKGILGGLLGFPTTKWDFEKNISILPSNIKPGSQAKVWWKCKKKSFL